MVPKCLFSKTFLLCLLCLILMRSLNFNLISVPHPTAQAKKRKKRNKKPPTKTQKNPNKQTPSTHTLRKILLIELDSLIELTVSPVQEGKKVENIERKINIMLGMIGTIY